MVFKPGDKVVFKPVSENPGNIESKVPVSLRSSLANGKPLTVVRSAPTFTHVEAEDGSRADAYTTRFKLAPTERDTSNDTATLGVDGARAAIKRLTEAGVPAKSITMRSRSWDEQGLYFALEVKGHPTALYHQQAVTEYIAKLTPIDVAFHLESQRAGAPVYQFRIPGTTYTLQSPYDGSYWFSQSDITRCKGIVEYGGKRYRLGKQVFEAFIK